MVHLNVKRLKEVFASSIGYRGQGPRTKRVRLRRQCLKRLKTYINSQTRDTPTCSKLTPPPLIYLFIWFYSLFVFCFLFQKIHTPPSAFFGPQGFKNPKLLWYIPWQYKIFLSSPFFDATTPATKKQHISLWVEQTTKMVDSKH